MNWVIKQIIKIIAKIFLQRKSEKITSIVSNGISIIFTSSLISMDVISGICVLAINPI